MSSRKNKIACLASALILLAGSICTAPYFSSAPTQRSSVAAAETVDRTFAFGSDMQGKSFVFFGDSLTESLYLGGSGNDYIDLLRTEFGFYSYNGGVCSATMSAPDGASNHVFAQLDKAEALCRDADYISFFFGANDFLQGRTLGSIDETPTKNTFCGAACLAIEQVVALNPDVKIMLITPTYLTNGYESVGSGGYTLSDMTDTIVDVGTKYQCKVVNTTTVFNASNIATMLVGDKIHITAAGYQLLANKIKA